MSKAEGESQGYSPFLLVFGTTTASAVGIWVALFPKPAVVVVPLASVLPLLAIGLALASRGVVGLGGRTPPSMRPSLAGMLFAPMVGLGYAAFRGGLLWYWTASAWIALGSAVAVGVAMAFIIGAVDRREMSDSLMMVCSGLLATAWAAGMIVLANHNLPPRHRLLTPGIVAHKAIRRRNFEIKIRTVDGRFEETFPVSLETFDALEIGDRRCIVRNQGALKVWWRDFEPCVQAPAP